MILLLLLSCIIQVKVTYCQDIASLVKQHYKDDILGSFRNSWEKQKKSHENALESMLQESFGIQGANLLVQKQPNKTIAHGIIVQDGAVDLLISKTTLKDLCRLKSPDVTFRLADNVLRVEGQLSRLVSSANYRIFRNDSSLVPADKRLNPLVYSPFTFHQVLRKGQLTIIADDCKVTSTMVVRLSGQSVSLGHDHTFLENCRFSVEISSGGASSPPVIAPYFPDEKAKELMRLFGDPVRQELRTRVSSLFYSQVNASAVLGDKLLNYKSKQRSLFSATNRFLTNLAGKLNRYTVSKGQQHLSLDDYDIVSDFKTNGAPNHEEIHLNNMKLHGLDSAYSGHTGGSFQLTTPMIAESIRFPNVHVTGDVNDLLNGTTSNYQFTIELPDLNVDIIMDSSTNKFMKISVTGWRSEVFSIVDKKRAKNTVSDTLRNNDVRYGHHALVSGYLSEHLPPLVQQYLSKALPNAAGDHTFDDNDENNESSDESCSCMKRKLSTQKYSDKKALALSDTNRDKGVTLPEINNMKKYSDNIAVYSDSSDPDLKGGDYVPYAKGEDYDPDLKGGDYDPDLKGQDYDPDLKGGDYDPDLKGGDYDPDLKGGDYDPDLKGGDYDPDLKGGDYVPDVTGGDDDPDVKGGDYVPDVTGGDDDPDVKGGDYVPDVTGGDDDSDVKGGDYVPDVTGGDDDPDVKGGDYVPDVTGGDDDPDANGGDYDSDITEREDNPDVKGGDYDPDLKGGDYVPGSNDFVQNANSDGGVDVPGSGDDTEYNELPTLKY